MRGAAGRGGTSQSSQSQAQSRAPGQGQGREAPSLLKRRQELLAADSRLARSYRDLVGGSILAEEDFWADKDELLEAIEGSNAAKRRGQATALIADVQTTEVDGEVKMKVTSENIQAIFRMYPAVKAAHETKVPLEMSDKEFWRAYFKSEYFKRDRAADAKNFAALQAAGVGSRTDDMFAEFEARAVAAAASAAGGAGRASGVGGSIATLQQGVDGTMDLTRTEGDHLGTRATRDAAEEDADPSLTAMPAVTQKYNRNSSLLLESSLAATATDTDTVPSSSSSLSSKQPRSKSEGTEDTLLKYQAEPEYIPLRIKRGDVGTAATYGATMAEEKKQEGGVASAFGKRELGGAGAVPSAQRARLDPALVTPTSVLIGLGDVFGTGGAFEMDVWRQDREHLKTQKILAKQDAAAGDGVVDLTGAAGGGMYGMSPQFTQYMLERFEEVTKHNLRYFYAYLTKLRDDQNHGRRREDVMERMRKLMKRIEGIEHSLMADKNSLGNDGYDVKYSLKCINDVLGLINRAKVNLRASKVLDDYS